MKIKHPATGKQLEVVTVDFETYFAQDYTLRSNAQCKMNMSEYVRSEQYKTQCCGFKLGTEKAFCVPGSMVEDVLDTINWSNAALLCHNTAFDGLILSHHYGVTPALYLDSLSMARALHSNEIGASLDEVAKFYGVGNKMQDVLGKTKGIRDLPDELLYPLMAYCQEDVRLTYEIFKRMIKGFPADELELIDITISAFCDPVLKIDVPRCQKELTREIEHKKAVLKRATGTDDYEKAKEYLGKNEWLAQALTDLGIDPPMKYSIKQEKMVYAFAKGDEDFVALMDDEDSDAAALVEARLAVKSSIGETRAGRLLAMQEKKEWSLPVHYNFYGSHTGRWSGGNKCLSGDTEILTPAGWMRFDEVQGTHVEAMVADEAGKAWFASCPVVRVDYDGDMYEADSWFHKGQYTADHRIPYENYGKPGRLEATAAEMAERKKDWLLPISGKYEGGYTLQITENEARLLAAIQADGSFGLNNNGEQNGSVSFSFSKQRKVERMRSLLNSLPRVKYTESSRANGYTVFYLHAGTVPALTWLAPGKKFGPWLLDMPYTALDALVDETKYWDGHQRGRSWQYFSIHEENITWLQIAAHLTGRSATTRWADNDKRGYGKGTAQKIGTVAIKPKQFALMETKRTPLKNTGRFTGIVYCLSTPKQYFFIRRNGVVTLTLNCNFQNFPRGGELRKCILAPKGFAIVTGDSAQIEARMNAWFWGHHELVAAFARGEDVYCIQAEGIYGMETIKGRSDEDDDRRQIGKVAILALGYQGANNAFNSMAKNYGVRLPEEQVTSIVRGWRKSNKPIVDGWATLQSVLKSMLAGQSGEFGVGMKLRYEPDRIWLPNGLCLKYPDLQPSFDKNGRIHEITYRSRKGRVKIYGGKMNENVIQALARIVVGEQIIQINRRYRTTMTTHDEGSWLARLKQADSAAKWIEDQMSIAPDWAPGLPVASEVKWGTYYSK